MFAESVPWRPFEECQQAFETFCRHLQWVTEDGVRVQLAEMGFSGDEVHRQLQRARSMRDMRDMEFTWERTTRIGFRNKYRQVGRPFTGRLAGRKGPPYDDQLK